MKPGVDASVLRYVTRGIALAIMVAATVWKDKLGTELYALVYGFGSASLGNTFTNKALGQVDGVQLQELHDSLQPPAPPPDQLQ